MDYEKLLSKYQYADIRIEKSTRSNISIKDDEVKCIIGSSDGIGVRVLDNGSWGIASGDNESLDELLKKAHKLAKLSTGRISCGTPIVEKKSIKEKIIQVNHEEQIGTLVDAAKAMKGEKIASKTITCIDAVITAEFYNSLGTEIVQDMAYTYTSCACVAKSGEIIQRGSARTCSREGFKKIENKIYETAENAKQKALELLNSITPPQGRFTAILDPEMTGVLCHEAIGHACEGDAIVDNESILVGKIGKNIGNELVNIVDDPTAKDFGHYYYDDEGIRGKQTRLIENGILKEYMNSMETAYALGIEPNGHARSQAYDSVPVVRMSNTYFRPGKASVDDVFDVKHGIYLKGMKGGSVNIFSGGFMFKAERAYEIKNGEKGNIIRDVTITGSILETLNDVEIVGKDFGTSPGICGKAGQEAPVSDGGPHIRVNNVTIG